MNIPNPCIVVVAFNRPNSLKRLLNSIKIANYPNRSINLIISIDFHNSTQHTEVVEISENFIWEHGLKEVLIHKSNQGLRKHVISCGDLTRKYGSLILLEDDLFVSKEFYNYARYTLSHYENEDMIGGVSLYTHQKNFVNSLNFRPIGDNFDVHFLQIASSWGQAWTKKQWSGFRSWYDKAQDISLINMPSYIKKWPESSWLKYFIGYLVESNLYFVYPNYSLATNYGDSGTHNLTSNHQYQVSLSNRNRFVLPSIVESNNVYDSYFEILPDRLKNLQPELKSYDFTVDMYGLKELQFISTELVLTSKKVRKNKILKSYGLSLRPIVNNIIYKSDNNFFHLSFKKNISKTNLYTLKNYFVFDFNYSSPDLKCLIVYCCQKVLKKFLR
ncbi:hypothetical protein [Leeuwenhoekiella sp. H156]|uniref:hypothetical protein n=1 Tax=Leeuwenhoekiella sp. H156 TaxID=3450128 RepID=UPI003FA40933